LTRIQPVGAGGLGSVTNANIVANAGILLSKLQASTITQFQPANPTSTNSASLVMLGVGGTVTVTSTKTGKLLIIVSGRCKSDTAGDGVKILSRYGTGTAPINGAALTGTAFVTPAASSVVNVQNENSGTVWLPFTIVGFLDNSANLNVATWFDLAYAVVTGGNALVTELQWVFVELSN